MTIMRLALIWMRFGGLPGGQNTIFCKCWKSSRLKWHMNSEKKVPIIPKGRPISWADWRWARRETGNRVAPENIRRTTSSSDQRLRKLFKGERGLPFKSVEEL